MLKTIETVLASAVADAGTFTVNYPAGTSRGLFLNTTSHQLSLNYGQVEYGYGFSLTFNASNITVTNNSGYTWAAGSRILIGLDIPGDQTFGDNSGSLLRTYSCDPVIINIGSPAAASANGICLSQSVTVATTPKALLNGALASGGKITLDAPRNVVAAWTGTAVITVRGFDEYGQRMMESSASGTSFTGKKAFAIVDDVRFSANVTAATVGTGNVLGYSMFVPFGLAVIRTTVDNSNETVAAFVAGDTTKPTATTGDVRGTFTPTNVPDGSRAYHAYVYAVDKNARGLRQYYVAPP